MLLGALAFVQMQFHVENVSVEGNVHYTKEEIEAVSYTHLDVYKRQAL